MRSSSHQLHFTSFYISTSRSTIAGFVPIRKFQWVSTFWKISLVFVSSIYLTFLPFYFLLHNGVWSRTRESCLEALGGFVFGCYISLLPAFMSAGSLPTQYVVGSWWRWVLLDPCGDCAFVFWSVDSICWQCRLHWIHPCIVRHFWEIINSPCCGWLLLWDWRFI